MYRHQGYNYVGIPAFENYAQIKAHYQAIAPIRGREEKVRPIGRRRYDWYQITEKQVAVDLSPENPLGSYATAYCAVVYRTECVEWLPNEDIILRVPSWRGPTSMGMLTYALASHGTIVSASGKWYFQNKNGEHYLLAEGKEASTLIRKGEDGMYRATEVAQEYTYKASRKALNALRKKYKEFFDYAKNMVLIDSSTKRDWEQNNTLSNELGMNGHNLIGRWGSAKENRTEFLSLARKAIETNDLDLMYKLATYAMITFGRYLWVGNNNESMYKCYPEEMERGLNEVLKYEHSSEVFTAVEVEKGKVFIDRNAKYVQ